MIYRSKGNISEEWKNYQNFKLWFDSNYFKKCQIDKDLKIPGNKIYSIYTCTMVPSCINNLFGSYGSKKDMSLPYGIQKSYNSYRSNGKVFVNKSSAVNFYWNEKYKYIQLAILQYPQFKELLENYFEYWFNKHYPESL